MENMINCPFLSATDSIDLLTAATFISYNMKG